jgi:hypothetical protein
MGGLEVLRHQAERCHAVGTHVGDLPFNTIYRDSCKRACGCAARGDSSGYLARRSGLEGSCSQSWQRLQGMVRAWPAAFERAKPNGVVAPRGPLQVHKQSSSRECSMPALPPTADLHGGGWRCWVASGLLAIFPSWVSKLFFIKYKASRPSSGPTVTTL